MLPSEKRLSRTTNFCRAFILPNIYYNCDKCLSTSANTKTDSKHVHLQNKLSTISNICADISSSLSLLPNSFIPKSLNLWYSIVNQEAQSSHSSSTTYIPTNAIYRKNHIIFEHLKPEQRHLDFVKSVFNYVDIDPNCITNISFKSHYANIDLISPCVRNSFLKVYINYFFKIIHSSLLSTSRYQWLSSELESNTLYTINWWTWNLE